MKTSKNKAVIWLRVSTVRQEIESQREDLIRIAREDGFTANQLLFIEGKGISARTQNEKYIRELEHLKEVIEVDPTVNTVYAWEVSRLARIQSKLHDLQEFLVKRGIQLVIIEPKIRLLKEDGTVDSGEEIKLSILATLAKQEMEIKLSRSKRGRDRNRKQGRFNGGAFGALYGYSVDSNGFIVPDPEEVEVVNTVFTLYSTGKYSIRSLAEELKAQGYNFRGRRVTDSNVNNILTNTFYIGEPGQNGRKYTAIIERKLWEKALKVRKNQTINITKTKESRHTHLATKLLKCGYCGYNYTASKGKYVCYKHSLGYRFAPEDQCLDSVGVSIEVIDGIFWEVSKMEDIQTRKSNSKYRIPELKKEMKVLGKKLGTVQDNRGKCFEKRERIIENYEEGLISKVKRDERLEKIQEQLNELEVEEDKLRRQVKFTRFDLLRHVKGLQDKNLPVYNNYTLQERRDLVVRYILQGTVKRIVFEGRKAIEIKIQLVRGGEVTYIYFYTLKDKEKQLRRIN